MTKIAIIVPVYKVRKYLRECIDSILAQTYQEFRLVLVDDGSPDECGEICDGYAKKDSRIHVIHQENQGLSAARNSGIDFAMCDKDLEYIVFVDSDDWVSKSYIEDLLQGARLSGSVACTGYARFFEDGRVIIRNTSSTWQLTNTEDYWCHPDPLTLVAWGKIFPKSFFKDVRFPLGRIHEDVFTTHKLLFQTPRLAVMFKPLYHYRCRTDSLSGSNIWSAQKLDAVYGMIEQCDYLRTHGFYKAYAYARGQLLGMLSATIKSVDLIGGVRAADFSEALRTELARGPVPFWPNRAYYRNTMKRCFWLRWFLGMICDFVKEGRRSWIVRECIPMLKDILYS